MWWSIRTGRLAYVSKRKWDYRMHHGVCCETGDWRRMFWRLFWLVWKNPKEASK